jgi:hypothetical protein
MERFLVMSGVILGFCLLMGLSEYRKGVEHGEKALGQCALAGIAMVVGIGAFVGGINLIKWVIGLL